MICFAFDAQVVLERYIDLRSQVLNILTDFALYRFDQYTTGWTGSGGSQSDKKVSIPESHFCLTFAHLMPIHLFHVICHVLVMLVVDRSRRSRLL